MTGSARMETFRQSGESLAGRYFAWRLHPVSVAEWCAHAGASPEAALRHLMRRGGFPEPCLAATDEEADRWRAQYATDLVREDVLELFAPARGEDDAAFPRPVARADGCAVVARLHRPRSGGSDGHAQTLSRHPAGALHRVRAAWHRNVARATLQAPKVYFFDTGMVRGDDGARLENAVAAMLLRHVHFRRDALGRETGLHYIRTKDGAEVDFAISEDDALTHLVECKYADAALHRPLARFAETFPDAQAVQLVAELRQEENRGRIAIRRAGDWLAGLE